MEHKKKKLFLSFIKKFKKQAIPISIISIVIGFIVFIAVLIATDLTTGDNLPKQIGGALLEAVITALITYFLLNSQTSAEETKEKKSIVFEKKLQIYQVFMEKIHKVIEDNNFTKDGHNKVKELIFQLSYIKMHTKSDHVAEIFTHLINIMDKLVDNKGKTPSGDYYKILIENLYKIVGIFQQSLYEKELGSNLDNEAIEKVKKMVEKIEEIANDKPVAHIISKDIPPDEKKQWVSKFNNTLVSKLTEKLSGGGWDFTPEKNNSRINLAIKNNKWPEGAEVGIFDYDDDRAHFAVKLHGEEGEQYKSLYLTLRSKFGGRFNKWNWWLILKEPYDKWDENEEGIKAVWDCDDKFINYLLENLCEIIKYINIHLCDLVKLYKLKNEIGKNDSKNEIYIDLQQDENYYNLIIKYKIHDDELHVYAGFTGEKFKIKIHEENSTYFQKNKPDFFETIKEFTKDAEIKEIKDTLQDKLNGYEKDISDIINKMRNK